MSTSTLRRSAGLFAQLATVLALAVGLAVPAAARMVVDSSGRHVEVPDAVHRVFAAGPPAAVLLYVVAPKTLVGWPRAPRADDLPFLLPGVRDQPELGRLTGRGDTINTERLMASHPDIIIDFGTLDDTYRSLADRIQAQTGIPYLLIDGRFGNTPAALRLLGDILGVSDRAETLARAAETAFAQVDQVLAKVPATERPRIYLARGIDGLETGSRGSINTEILERVGGVNVVEGVRDAGGIAKVSPEQVITWAPDTIVTIDPKLVELLRQRPEWRPVPAVAERRIFLVPQRPFGSIDYPPSVNRLIGLPILLHLLYPQRVTSDVHAEVRTFYRLFYQVDVSNDVIDDLLGAGR
ncbi:MAG: iron ABC transporter substrate-binding protein [Ancalomicrobiaceae bacterium]|nr:iron ABC transporter substrate-binding protein [Ancalomicrobiaceae bacterium]